MKFPRPNHHLVRIWLIPDYLTPWWNVVLAIGAFVAGAAQVLDRKLAQKTWPWIHSSTFQVSLNLIVLGLVALQSGRRAILRFRDTRAGKVEIEIQKVLAVLIAAIADGTDVYTSELGAAVFLEQLHYQRPWRRLRGAARLRMVDRGDTSGIIFDMRTGAIGAALSKRTAVHHDWSRLNKSYAENLPTREDWEQFNDADKHGFTYEHWCLMVGRYTEVIALRIMVREKPYGVLVVDRSWDWEPDEQVPVSVLNARNVREALQVAVGTLAVLLH